MRVFVVFSLMTALLSSSANQAVAGHGCVTRKVRCIDPCRRRIEVEICLPCVRGLYYTRPVVEERVEIVERPILVPQPAIVASPVQRQTAVQQVSTAQQQTGPQINFNPNINVQVQPSLAGPVGTAAPNVQSNVTSGSPSTNLAFPSSRGAAEQSPPVPVGGLAGLVLSPERLEWQVDASKARYFTRYRMQSNATGRYSEQILFFYPSPQRNQFIYVFDLETGDFWARCVTAFHPAFTQSAPQWHLLIDGHWNLIESAAIAPRRLCCRKIRRSISPVEHGA